VIEMAAVAFAFPILPGKTDMFRRVAEELLAARRTEYELSRARLGIAKERAWLQHTPQGDVAIVYLEVADPALALQKMAASDDPFDQWFRQYVLDVHGMDLTQLPSAPLPEQTFEWEVRPAGF
jgi:hypothetical protein